MFAFTRSADIDRLACASALGIRIAQGRSQFFSEPSAFIAHINVAIVPLHRGNKNKVSPMISGK